MSGSPLPSTIGRYDVLARIGRGGMGVVYRARDPRIGRDVAIKLLAVVDEDLRQRCLQEIRLLGTLNHPHIVSIYDCGEHDEQPFIVMEHVDGVTMADAIRLGLLPSTAAKLQVIRELCSALESAHNRSIIHRDIKPSNLMIDRGGTLKVLDFGVARFADVRATRTGLIVGTPSYMAPEQIAHGTANKQTDIFSVGLVIYEMFASRQAFPSDGKTPIQVIHNVLHEQPPPLRTVMPELDPELERIVDRSIQKDPSARYETLSLLAKDMSIVQARLEANEAATQAWMFGSRMQGEAPASPPPAAVGAAAPTRPWLYPLVGLLAALCVGAAVTAWTIQRTPLSSPVDHRTAPNAGVPSLAPSAPEPAPPSPPVVPVRSVPAQAEASVVRRPAANTPPGSGPAPSSAKQGPYDQGKQYLPAHSRNPDPKRAVVLFQRACDQGDVRGCSDLAEILEAGAIVAKDESRAVLLYRRACDGGSAEGCNSLAKMYNAGQGTGKDVAAAADLYQRACDGGSAAGCNSLGVMFARGAAVAKDEAKAVSLYQRACDGLQALACVNLGIAFQNGRGVPKDLGRARVAYEKSCDNGYNWGCADLGGLLIRGDGGAKDERRAAELFQRACDSGLPEGCNDLGLAYARGTGVEKSEVRAFAMYERSCGAGAAAGCTNLGTMYRDGRAVAKDDVRAATLFQRACDGGRPPGCAALGFAFANGRGVPKDENKASAAYQRACDGNDANACNTLGDRSRRGLGAKMDDVDAAKYFQRGCDGGSAAACRTLSRMYDQGQGVPKDPGRAADLALRADAPTTAGAAANASPPTGGRAAEVIVPAPPGPPAGIVRAGGEIKIPAKVKNVEPTYPVAARYARVQGLVILEVTVDSDGRVTQTKIIRSIPLLDAAAEEAVKQWRFARTIVNGAAVPVVFNVSVGFSLEAGGGESE